MTEKPTSEELEKRIQELKHVEYKFKRAEEALQESEGRYRAVVEDMPGLICSFLPDGEITFVNKAYCEYFDETFEELVGTNFLSLIPESEHKAVMDNISGLKVESPTQSHEHTVIAPNGDIRWQRWTNRALFDDQGKTVGYQSIGIDITARKRAEDALRESEEKYRELVQHANSIILRFDTQGRITFFNDFAQSFFGFTEDEILHHNLVGKIVPQTESSGRDLKAMIEDMIRNPARYVQNENENIKRNSERAWIAWTNKAILGQDGNVSEILCIGMDITDRKQAEDALRKSETMLKSIFRAAPTGIGMVCNRILQRVNDRLCEMVGYSSDELVGQSARMLYPSKEEFKWVGEEKYAQIREQGTGTVETHWKRKDGSIIDVLLSSSPIDPVDPSASVTFTALDITDRKQAKKSLRESEERFHNVYNTAPLAFIVWDINTHVIDWNKKAEEVFGWSKGEVVDFNFFDFLIPEKDRPHVEDIVDSLLKGNLPSHTINDNLTKDGKIITCEWNNSPLHDKDGNIIGVISLGLDITERKQAEEALRQSQEKIARLQKMESLGLLAGGVAHDLNNVLSGIVSYPELLLLDLPEDSRLRKPIETMEKSGHRAVAIVQDLLTVARGVATMKEPLNLNDIIREYLQSPEFHKDKEHHPEVTIKTNLDNDLLNIAGSLVHIRKVVMNLVSNAAEAIEGSGNVAISTVNRYIDKPLKGYDDVKTGEYAVLAVSDDGSGISSEDLERIFEPFYTKKVMGRSGTGLGLAVVWNVMQDHQGYIDVQSTENGTTFELYFPITREAITDRESSIPIGDYKGAGETILIVDDVEAQREIACNMLDVLGYKTSAVSSGEEAVKYLQAHTVDLILLDMIMDPGINGRETYERVIKIHPNQKAVIASGFAETDEVREAQRLGAGPFIKKPFTLEKIGSAIKDELK